MAHLFSRIYFKKFLVKRTLSTFPIIVNTKYLIIVNSGKLRFHMACKDGQFMNNQFKAFGINLNAQHVNGMTP